MKIFIDTANVEEIKELCQRFRIVRTGAAANDKGMLLRTFGCLQRDLRQIQHLQDIGVAHLILNGNT